MNRRPCLVGYSPSAWTGPWRPRHEYLKLLARRGWPALYTSGPSSIWDRDSDQWRATRWRGRCERVNGLLIDQAGRIPFRWPGKALDVWTLKWHARHLRRLLRIEASDELMALVFHPSFWPHVEALRPTYVVYYQYDAFSKMPGQPVAEREFEERLVARADLIVTVTEPMLQMLPGTGPTRARPLANAVRLDSFEGAERLPCPPDLATIPRPRIGHIGTLSIRINLDLILSVAQARPDCQFVFIGALEREGNTHGFIDPVLDEKWRRLRALSNVHYIAPRPAELAPAYMAHMDINAMWYDVFNEGWWTYAKPIKTYEYLAVGQPIIATGLDGVRDYSAVIDIADTTEEWVAAIDRALKQGGVGTPAERIAVARDNSWAKRAETLERWMFEIIDASRSGLA